MNIKKIWKALSTPSYLVEVFLRKTSSLWPDKLYITLLYRVKFGKSIDWKNPKTFNEKLNWEKLYLHEPRFTIMADKYDVKKYVANIIGEEYIVPCYGVWEKYEDIPFETLPDKFVIKMTHDSFGAIVCRDKSVFDYKKAHAAVKYATGRNWFPYNREWVYKDIKPRIIIDKFLDDHSGRELKDYKFWCFNGEPKIMYFTNKAASIFENFYDMSFRPLDINHGAERHKPEFEKPQAFDLMKKLATKLSKDIPFVRVDFFFVDGQVYFGEYTFYDWGGMKPFADDKWDYMLGSWIQLPFEEKVNR